MPRTGYVYILASKSKHLYIGTTTNLCRRWIEHRRGLGSRQARDYRVFHLVYVEECSGPLVAIRREKQLKGWRRARKIALVTAYNREWRDLAVQWGWHQVLAI
jgi:putative endonuclease